MIYKFRESHSGGEVKNEMIGSYTNVTGHGDDWVEYHNSMGYITKEGADTQNGEYFTQSPDGVKESDAVDERMAEARAILRGEEEVTDDE